MASKPYPPGPWDSEPDRVDFEHAGLPCVMLRAPLGQWCGYAGVPPSHRWHGLGYFRHEPVRRLDVHGGITFSGRLRDGPADHWFFGFDCAHAWDLVPGLVALNERLGEGDVTYRAGNAGSARCATRCITA